MPYVSQKGKQVFGQMFENWKNNPKNEGKCNFNPPLLNQDRIWSFFIAMIPQRTAKAQCL
jgi:hypothetical protein